ncbi:MAG: hypothetical protein Kow00128_13900 [Deltaproteobacteria bacterium]
MDPVLVVTANRELRQRLDERLAEKGLPADSAKNGTEALALLGRREIPLLLLDMGLPDRESFRIVAQVERFFPETGIVLLGEAPSEEESAAILLEGRYEWLPRDATGEVGDAVRRALDRRADRIARKTTLERQLHRNRELQLSVRRLTSMIDAGRAMSAIRELPDLLDYFMGLVVRELDVERASLMLIDEASGEMRIASSRGISDEVVQTVRVKMGEGISGWVAQTGKPIVVQDSRNDPRVRDRILPNLSGSFISAPVVLSIPVRFLEKVLGVINVTRKRTGGTFDQGDMEYLVGLAGQAAVAIERARHQEELQAAYESLRSAQDQIVASERLNALGQMAAGVAHDFNNILTGILGRVQLLQMKVDSGQAVPAALREELGLVERMAMQGAETVRRVQEFTRIRKDVPQDAVHLNEVVRNAIEVTRPRWKEECEARGIRIEVREELGEIPPTAGNGNELAQVMSNLIFNALEAMPRGGRLTFRTARDGDWIRLVVSDTGEGMPPEVVERIFEPFFTTKEKGTGLGMSIVYGIVTRYGGKITVHSREGEGTTFHIRLPVVEPRSRMPDRRKAAPRGERSRARILIVEDDDLNRELFRDALSAQGNEVRAAATGAEGLEMFRRAPFDLVITDLSMPGMSGWEVSRGVKRIAPEVPVILLSGWAIQQDEASVKTSGVDCILAKPCSIRQLRDTVEEILKGGVEA